MKYLFVICLLFAGCATPEETRLHREFILEQRRDNSVDREKVKQDAKTERTRQRMEAWNRLPFLKDKEKNAK